MKAFLKTKFGVVSLLTFFLLINAVTIYDIKDLLHQSHTRKLVRAMIAASDEFEKSPAGLPRGETFLNSLKAIDTDGAPNDLKKAIQDYIQALQEALDTFKAGQDPAQFDDAIGRAKQRLLASVRKYE